MSLNEHVSVTITQDTVRVRRAGFGVPMHLSYHSLNTDRIRFYTDEPSVIADGHVVGSPEQLFANRSFSQTPSPTRIAIGRGILPPTKRFSLSTKAPIQNLKAYQLRAVGPTFDSTVTFTSDGTATDAEIAAGLVTQLNGVSGKNYTAAGAASPITVTGNSAGAWFAIEVLDLNLLTIAEDHVDPGVATDLAAIAVESADWYALHTAFNSDAYVKAAAAWVEANKRLYVPAVNNTDDPTTTSNGTNGTGDDIKALSYKRTEPLYHPRLFEMPSAAWYGSRLPLNPGSETWAYATGVGVTPAKLTATQRANLDARFMSYYKEEAGESFFWQGWVASGSYIDVTRGLDAFEDDLVKAIFVVLKRASDRGEKIPYTPEGAALIVAEVRGSLKRFETRGLFVPGSSIVAAPDFALITPTQKAQRLLPDIKFFTQLAGAIHRVGPPFSGVVSL
jgi:hypothetical protein